ncbi:major facilitator superfamily domain-containing protein [Mycena rebaudengoi]|nr:major facilitator superfamily domain-containing protein [Mycena rebaudengoi]
MMDDQTEETPLLSKPEKARTPLPKLQLAVIMLVQICEPIGSQSIYPYINQLVSELDITGGDDRKESLFYMTEAMTILQWSRASDHIGRKPILLLGLFGTALSMICFGLSRTFWTLVVSRCLTGLLNGNIGVMKSVMGDLTDPSNRAEGFAYIPVVWDLGASLGPLIGGQLSRPHDRFPHLFSGRFWIEYPYFLPCFAIAGIVLFSGLVVLALFKESAPNKKSRTLSESDDLQDPRNPPCRALSRPLPLREMFTFPVVISICNYVSQAFLDIALRALVPLFLAMPIEIGGLGLAPDKIGLILGAQGAAVGTFQVFFCAKIIRRLGDRGAFLSGVLAFLPVWLLFPVISTIAKGSGLSCMVWILLGCLLALSALVDTAYGAVFMFLTASAPKGSRGTANGLAQTSVSIARAIGPVLSTSLFSLSVQRNLLSGYAVYALFFVVTLCAVMLGRRLPPMVWEEFEEED